LLTASWTAVAENDPILYYIFSRANKSVDPIHPTFDWFVKFYSVQNDTDVAGSEYPLGFFTDSNDSETVWTNARFLGNEFVIGEKVFSYKGTDADGKLLVEKSDRSPSDLLQELDKESDALNARGTALTSTLTYGIQKGRFQQLVELNSNTDLYSDSFGVWIISRTDPNQRPVLVPAEGVEFPINQALSVVEYRPGRLAFVDSEGYVKRIDVSDPAHPRGLNETWVALRTAVARGDVAQLARIFRYSIDPIEPGPGQGPSENAIDLVLKSGNTGLAVNLIKELGKYVSVPFESNIGVHNPVYAFIDSDNDAALEAILAWKPSLANAVDSRASGGSPRYVPITQAVRTGRLETCKILMDSGAEPEQEWSDAYGPINCLTFSSDPALDRYLISRGVKTELELNTTATCTSDHVRVRASYNTNSEILGSINTGDRVTVVAATAKNFVVNGASNRWYKIKTDTLEGWTFGEFLTGILNGR
jgi:hypothetical protein